MPDQASVRRILVAAYGHITDVLAAGPALHALRDSYPQARISLLVIDEMKELVAACPYVDQVLTFRDFQQKNTRWDRLEKLLRLAQLALRFYGRFDMTVMLHIDLRLFLRLGWVTGASARAGLPHSGAPPRLLTHPADAPSRNLSHRDKNRRVLEAIGVTRIPASLELWTTPQDEQAAQALLSGHQAQPDDLLIGLHPGAHWTCQQWSPQDWARVADALVSHYGARLIITGSADERDLAQQIIQQMHAPDARVIDATGQTTILQFGALVKRMRLFVCVNSSASQIGLAVGTPTLTLVGYENPVWTGAAAGEALSIIRQCDDVKAPGGWWCPYHVWHMVSQCHRAECMGIGGMSVITPDLVLRQVERQLKARGTQPGSGAAKPPLPRSAPASEALS